MTGVVWISSATSAHDVFIERLRVLIDAKGYDAVVVDTRSVYDADGFCGYAYMVATSTFHELQPCERTAS